MHQSILWNFTVVHWYEVYDKFSIFAKTLYLYLFSISSVVLWTLFGTGTFWPLYWIISFSRIHIEASYQMKSNNSNYQSKIPFNYLNQTWNECAVFLFTKSTLTNSRIFYNRAHGETVNTALQYFPQFVGSVHFQNEHIFPLIGAYTYSVVVNSHS